MSSFHGKKRKKSKKQKKNKEQHKVTNIGMKV